MLTDKRNSTSVSILQGFLVHGLVWGIVAGYVLADLAAETNGLLVLGTPRSKTSVATTFILVCPAIGLIVGLLFDLFKNYDPYRVKFLNISCRLLGWCTLIYLVVTMFANLPRVH